MISKKKITKKQELFKKYYMDFGPEGGLPGPAFGNATKATKMAGYECKNPGSYRVIGYENIRKLNIREEMNKQFKEREKKYFKKFEEDRAKISYVYFCKT